MEQRLTPDFFFGSAIAALAGILLGLMLHGPWHKHPGGPQIWSASPAAEALIQPPKSEDEVTPAELAQNDAVQDDAVQADAAPAAQDVADVDVGYVPPDPLPVTRLDPDRFDPKPAAFEAPQREDVEETFADTSPSPRPDLD